MSNYGKIPQGWYTGSDYWGWVGNDPHGYIAKHNPGKYLEKNGRLYMRFENEGAYLDWWQDQWKGD